VLGLIASQIDADAARSGFELSDSVNHGDAGASDGVRPAHDAVQLLGYRRSCQDEPLLLLEFCQALTEQLIIGTVWRPEDLVDCDREASTEAVACFYRAWQYDDTTTPQALAGDVADELRHWLVHLDGDGATLTRPPAADLRQSPSAPGTAEERTSE